MMTCGGAVTRGAVFVVEVAVKAAAGSRAMLSMGPRAMLSDGTVDVVVRPERLMSDATIEPVTEATPMMEAAMIGPHLVKLIRPWLCGATEPVPSSCSFTLTAWHRHESDRGFTETVRNGAQATGPTTHCAVTVLRSGCFLWNTPLRDELGSPPLASPY